MPISPRVAVVTGANRGIGLAIVRGLALSYKTSPLNNGSLLIYLTAREKTRGEEAVQALLSEDTSRGIKLFKANGGDVDLRFKQLDVARNDGDDGVDEFSKTLLAEHGHLDMLVNNAGIAIDGNIDSKNVQQLLRTNYFGLVGLTLRFLPHMPTGSRVVNMASLLGKLSRYPAKLVEGFHTAASSSTLEETDRLMHAYEEAVDRGTYEQDGWPGSPYVVSKSGVIAATKVLDRQQRESGGSRGRVLINCCCPGYVKTGMTKGRGVKDVDAGAKTPVLLALGDIGDTGGEFWEKEKVSSW